MSSFFNKIPKKEKPVTKPLSVRPSEWELIEKYLEFGTSIVGDKLNHSDVLKEIILGHIDKDREFKKWSNNTSKA